MEEGRTGFIVRELEDAVAAARRVRELSRDRCREVFEKRFTSRRMASDYLQVYERIICQKSAFTTSPPLPGFRSIVDRVAHSAVPG
jgi:hypothetical protein